MRIFNQPTIRRTEKSIINWEDENVEVCHAPNEDPKELVKGKNGYTLSEDWIQPREIRGNQEQFQQEYMGNWEASTSSPQYSYEPYMPRRAEPVPMGRTVESIGEHIKDQAYQYIEKYMSEMYRGGQLSNNHHRDEDFLKALKDKLLNDARAITPLGIDIEDLRVERVMDHRTLQPRVHFQLIFNNGFDRQRINFELNVGDYY